MVYGALQLQQPRDHVFGQARLESSVGTLAMSWFFVGTRHADARFSMAMWRDTGVLDFLALVGATEVCTQSSTWWEC